MSAWLACTDGTGVSLSSHHKCAITALNMAARIAAVAWIEEAAFLNSSLSTLSRASGPPNAKPPGGGGGDGGGFGGGFGGGGGGGSLTGRSVIGSVGVPSQPMEYST